MSDTAKFLGTWVSQPGSPPSRQTITWTMEDRRLRGRWFIGAADSPTVRAINVAAGLPARIEMPVGEPTVEDDRLLFQILFPGRRTDAETEFRLVGQDEAEVGAALDKLPTAFLEGDPARARAMLRSMEGHRVRLIRERAASD